MSNGAAIEALMQGPQAKMVKTFYFTLPEGRSRRENIPARQQGVQRRLRQGDDQPAPCCGGARRLGSPRNARSLEGFLFPATYQMITGASASDLVERQLDAFRENFATVNMKHRAAPQPDPLRRPHHRLDGGARGAARRRSAR